jgi:hypothetical protein
MTRCIAVLFIALAFEACGGGGSNTSTLPQSVGVSPTATPAGPTPTPAPTATPTASSSSTKRVYVIGQFAIPALAADPQASQILVGRKLYIIIDTVEPVPATPPAVPAGWTPTWIYRWTSEAQMSADFASGSVPSWITVTMYDNELNTSPATPLDEQNNPPMYTTMGATVAHAAGRKYWPTAGLATNAGYPGGTAQEQTDYWNTSATWDGYAIQSQTAIDNLPQFDSLIATYAANASALNGALAFTAGVGDFSGGTFAPLSTIEAAIPTIPAGYSIWMNFGAHGGPDCTDPNACPIPARYDMVVSIVDYFG